MEILIFVTVVVVGALLVKGGQQGSATAIGCMLFWAALALLFMGPVGWFILAMCWVGFSQMKNPN
jgi:hypothetical protein